MRVLDATMLVHAAYCLVPQCLLSLCRSRRILNFRLWPNAENERKAWDESVRYSHGPIIYTGSMRMMP